MITKIHDYTSNLFELSRPWSWFTTASLIVGVYCSLTKTIALWPNLIVSLAAIICIVAGSFALNDWFDRTEDTKIHPNRVLPSARMKPNSVLLVSVAEFLVGILMLSTLG